MNELHTLKIIQSLATLTGRIFDCGEYVHLLFVEQGMDLARHLQESEQKEGGDKE